MPETNKPTNQPIDKETNKQTQIPTDQQTNKQTKQGQTNENANSKIYETNTETNK